MFIEAKVFNTMLLSCMLRVEYGFICRLSLFSQHCADSNSERRNALRHGCVMTCTPRPAHSTATTTWPAGKPAPPFVYAV